MANLLMHNKELPPLARHALHAAQNGPIESRSLLLQSAARILHDEVGVDCADALELVGLERGSCR